MWDLGAVAFASPWVLAAAATLPLIWFLLRITPPAMRRVAFPAVILMFGLKPTQPWKGRKFGSPLAASRDSKKPSIV